MALTKCPDCWKDVSDSAPACPYCGRPFGTHRVEKSVWRMPVGAFIALGLLALAALWVLVDWWLGVGN